MGMAGQHTPSEFLADVVGSRLGVECGFITGFAARHTAFDFTGRNDKGVIAARSDARGFIATSDWRAQQRTAVMIGPIDVDDRIAGLSRGLLEWRACYGASGERASKAEQQASKEFQLIEGVTAAASP